jgi:hypothetical protein
LFSNCNGVCHFAYSYYAECNLAEYYYAEYHSAEFCLKHQQIIQGLEKCGPGSNLNCGVKGKFAGQRPPGIIFLTSPVMVPMSRKCNSHIKVAFTIFVSLGDKEVPIDIKS